MPANTSFACASVAGGVASGLAACVRPLGRGRLPNPGRERCVHRAGGRSDRHLPAPRDAAVVISTTGPRLEPAAHSPEEACDCEAPLTSATDSRARRVAWALTAATIAWNTLEAVVSIVSGMLAGSIALVGFGLDSVVEVSSAVVIIWRLSLRGSDHAANERAERRATMSRSRARWVSRLPL